MEISAGEPGTSVNFFLPRATTRGTEQKVTSSLRTASAAAGVERIAAMAHEGLRDRIRRPAE
ncbi:MAG: hypothetical protein IRY90_00995 [Actinomadura rubrobrunea]|nr:hypothetical protein [Actinomadura rubrobrunea]